METLATTWQMWFALAVVAGAVVGYASGRATLETVSGVVLTVLLVVFHLAPVTEKGEVVLSTDQLLAGFASPALFAIIGLLIVGQGMYQSGALEFPTRMLIAAHERLGQLAVIGVFGFVMVVSAFLNNTPVVVMFVPIMAAMAAQGKIAPSRLMMPLSFMSILGGMCTTIGSSTNLLAVAEYEVVTGNRLGFFALAPMGLVLAVVGTGYMAMAAKFFLPDRRGGSGLTQADGRQFVAQLTLERGNPLIGEESRAGLFPDLPGVTVRMIQRRDEVLLPPFDEVTLRLGDKVIVAATRKALTDLLKKSPQILTNLMSEVEAADGAEGELTMVEAVVAPGSRIVGRTISQIRFRFQTNCVIVGIQRRSRMIRSEVAHIRLEAGDVLLVLGDRADVRALRSDRDILMLEQSMQQLPDPEKARYAGFVFVAVVSFAAFGVLPISISAILGATAMVGVGCLNVRQAARAVDRRVYLLVGTALALGAALQQTGGAEYLAGFLAPLASGGGGPVLLISAFFAMTAVLTNVLSNNATAVLFTPIAVSASAAAGIDPLVLVLTVIYAANCSFATPVAYQTNLLVMAPGHYQFRDFVTVGVPLTVLLWAVYTVVAPAYFRATGLL